MITLAVANHKGGVGKTTTAVNLAAAMAARARVLLVDLDPLGQATVSLGINPRCEGPSVHDVLTGAMGVEKAAIPTVVRNLSLLAASPALETLEADTAHRPRRELDLANALWDARGFDVVVIDVPSGFGHLPTLALASAQRVIVPTPTQYLAHDALGAQMQSIYRATYALNPDLRLEGVLPTMVPSRCPAAKDVMAEIARTFGAQRLFAPIHLDARLPQAPSAWQPISWFAPHSRAAGEYRRLAEALLERFYGTSWHTVRLAHAG